jgi:adenylate kinase family enzyme
MKFPVFKTKIEGISQKFNLADPVQRQKYFQAKAGEEIKKLKKYLADGKSFIAYFLAKKGAGKGTYSRMMIEIFGADRITHLSVGDLVRDVDREIRDPVRRKKLVAFLRANYRGFHSLEEIIKAQESRSTKKLLPTEFILALIQREIGRLGKKAVFLDGFPRDLDQVSYSLFYRALIGYRDDPDLFVLIQVPESVIDERIKYRVICPKCQNSPNLKLLPMKEVYFDPEKKEFYFRCDQPACKGTRMVPKEGDELGIENVRSRLDKDGQLIKRAFSLYGVPKILLRNSIPADQAQKMVDDYEITPEFFYTWDKKEKKVIVHQKPWLIKDDYGAASYSLLAPAVVLGFIYQLVEVLDL